MNLEADSVKPRLRHAVFAVGMFVLWALAGLLVIDDQVLSDEPALAWDTAVVCGLSLLLVSGALCYARWQPRTTTARVLSWQETALSMASGFITIAVFVLGLIFTRLDENDALDSLFSFLLLAAIGGVLGRAGAGRILSDRRQAFTEARTLAAVAAMLDSRDDAITAKMGRIAALTSAHPPQRRFAPRLR